MSWLEVVKVDKNRYRIVLHEDGKTTDAMLLGMAADRVAEYLPPPTPRGGTGPVDQ